MNKSFTIVDKLNSVAHECNTIVRFNFDNNDYLVYYFPYDDTKCGIYTSKLISGSNNNYSISDISNTEKAKITDITNSVVISFPSSYSKDMDINKIVNDFCSKNNIVFSKEVPTLGEQAMGINSFLANSRLDYIEFAKKFYDYVLPRVDIQTTRNTLVWDVPSSFETIKSNGYNFSEIRQEATSNYTDNQVPSIENVQAVIPVNTANNDVNEYNMMNQFGSQTVVENNPNSIGYSGYNIGITLENNSAPNDFSNVFSNDFNINYGNNNFSQEGSSGGTTPELQSNKVKVLKKNAGYASNKYIVIGTICFIITSVIIATTIILIGNL